MESDADNYIMTPFMFHIFQTLVEHDDSEIAKEAILARSAQQMDLLNIDASMLV